ncbi:hypothetical protein GA0115243_110215 [Streptomyces sp. ScaeMP-e83]|nr:hypothetical protein GA0115243_110215 [Streptomyces sp. ScaeMP-e83]
MTELPAVAAITVLAAGVLIHVTSRFWPASASPWA